MIAEMEKKQAAKMEKQAMSEETLFHESVARVGSDTPR
jgi:hypothetical protein